LPDNVAELKEIITFYHKTVSAEIEEKNKQIGKIKAENIILREQLLIARAWRFAHRSEKWTIEDQQQAHLFDEAEIAAIIDDKPESVTIKTHKRRKKRSRDKLAPIGDEIVHELSPEEQVCEHCAGPLTEFARDKNEELEYIPAQCYRIIHHYPQYVCKNPACCRPVDLTTPEVKSALRKKSLIPKSFLSAGLAAYLFISKFVDHLPFYRLERIFSRIGVSLSRATMSLWTIVIGRKLRRVVVGMRNDLRAGVFATADETPMQVFNEKGRDNRLKSYMWLFTGERAGRPILIYQYHPSRGSPIPIKFLRKFTGILLTDGLAVYNKVTSVLKLLHAGCWAHVRRGFTDALKAGASKTADEALALIQAMYRIESIIRNGSLSPDQILHLRQSQTKPIIEKFFQLMKEAQTKILPRSETGKAIAYALGQEKKLMIFLEFSHVPIDNNITENYIRPFVLGRKNWLFSGSPRGASASVTIYTITQTAIANGLDPYWYMRYLLERLPALSKYQDFISIAPHRIDPKLIKQYAATHGGKV